MSMLIFERVRKICNQKKMSISQLERKSGLSNGAICKWKVSFPTIESLKKVAGALDITINELLDELDD